MTIWRLRLMDNGHRADENDTGSVLPTAYVDSSVVAGNGVS
jgi:hypothetical protein